MLSDFFFGFVFLLVQRNEENSFPHFNYFLTPSLEIAEIAAGARYITTMLLIILTAQFDNMKMIKIILVSPRETVITFAEIIIIIIIIDLRRLAVTQSAVKDHQLTLMWKTLMNNNNNNTNGSPNLGRKTRPYNNQRQKKKKMKICKIVDFAVPADHRIKLKEC